MRLRTRKIAVALAVVVLVAAAAGAFAFTELRGGATGPGAALGPPHFVEEAVAAGVDHTYGGPSRYATGGGVAVFDCDADGRPDLYVAGGENPAALYRNESAGRRGAAVHGLPDPVLDLTAVNGAYPIDVDGDGIVDLAVLRMGGASLLRGLGDCRFEPADERWSFDGGTGFAHRVQRDVGGRRRHCRPWRSATT